MIWVFHVCCSNKHCIDFGSDNQHFICEKKVKVLENLEYLLYNNFLQADCGG